MNDQPKTGTTNRPDATGAPDGLAAPRTPNGTPNASQALTVPTEARDGASTADTSPATELRTAATKLRKHIKHATDGPWVTSTVWSPRATSTSAVYSHAHPAGTVDSEVVASGRIRSGYGGIRNPWNAEYIALMQPAVGTALADWLELEADVIAARIAQDGTDEYAVGLGQNHALTVARLINGQAVQS